MAWYRFELTKPELEDFEPAVRSAFRAIADPKTHAAKNAKFYMRPKGAGWEVLLPPGVAVHTSEPCERFGGRRVEGEPDVDGFSVLQI